MRKHHYSSAQTGLASRFIRNFEGPYLVVRHPFTNHSDMLILRDLSTGKELSHPVNVVVVPDRDIIDLQSDNDAVVEMDKAMDFPVLYPSSSLIPSDLVQVAYQFGKYLYNFPCHTATASVACRHVYEQYPSAREILNSHGKLHGLTKVCPYSCIEHLMEVLIICHSTWSCTSKFSTFSFKHFVLLILFDPLQCSHGQYLQPKLI